MVKRRSVKTNKTGAAPGGKTPYQLKQEAKNNGTWTPPKAPDVSTSFDTSAPPTYDPKDNFWANIGKDQNRLHKRKNRTRAPGQEPITHVYRDPT